MSEELPVIGELPKPSLSDWNFGIRIARSFGVSIPPSLTAERAIALAKMETDPTEEETAWYIEMSNRFEQRTNSSIGKVKRQINSTSERERERAKRTILEVAGSKPRVNKRYLR